MACHEIAALRLGLMRVLGREDEAERQHELAELGASACEPGPLKALSEAQNAADLQRLFQVARAELDRKVSRTAGGARELPYLQTLLVLTKKVELDLEAQVEGLQRLYTDLERMHDFVHEIHTTE
jgi:hypothetical protein